MDEAREELKVVKIKHDSFIFKAEIDINKKHE